jgi:hypothetical protein
MKKYTPYLFPLIVLAIVFFLIFRWYNLRTERVANDLFGEGVQIENLTETEVDTVLNGLQDVSRVELEPEVETARGDIRYEISDGRVRFTVTAALPQVEEGYQVWLKEVDGDRRRLAFALEERKGGYMGSAALSADLLPFEVVVTRNVPQVEDELVEVVLRGTINQEE